MEFNRYDVTGKGLKAGMLVALLVGAIRTAARFSDDPVVVLGELNQRLIAQILPDTDVAVDGLRHPIDYESLKNSFRSSFRLLYIDSPLKDRWEHLRGHSRYTSLGMFEAADSHPVEQQIESLRGSAGFVVRNNGSLQHLYVVVDEAIRHFRKADRE